MTAPTNETPSDGTLTQDDLAAALSHFWHPVCRTDEVADDRPLAVRLLDRELAVARLGDGSWSVLDDRCLHRSARLSVGEVDGCEVRCAYHGWTWGADGRCTSIPSMPDRPIPERARIGSHAVQERYGLVWVNLSVDASSGPEASPVPLPRWSATDEPTQHALAGEPYVWPVGAPRRVENFFDLAHFAWVHDGSLGSRERPVPPLPEIHRHGHELRFRYDMPDFEPDDSAMYGASRYRVSMPCTVEIDFLLASGARRILWMTASPLSATECRSFWFMSRDDDLDGDDPDRTDAEHMAFQQQVLDEDAPVVSSQTPASFPLDPSEELSVHTDLVSNVYRRWMRELVRAYVDDGADAMFAAASLIEDATTAASDSSSHEPRTPSRAMSTMSAGE